MSVRGQELGIRLGPVHGEHSRLAGPQLLTQPIRSLHAHRETVVPKVVEGNSNLTFRIGGIVVYSSHLETGQWYYVAGTYNSSKTAVYINGVLSNSADSGSVAYVSADGRIGQSNTIYYNAAGLDDFNGTIDELAIFNRSLTASEINQIYEKGLLGKDYCEFTACGTVSSDLTLLNDVSSGGTCFTIGADNIVLDCAGYKITYAESETGYGINNTGGFNNVTIKNCVIEHTNSSVSSSNAIYYDNAATNGTIINNTIITSGDSCRGIGLNSGSNNTAIIKNDISTSGGNSFGIEAYSSSYNNLTNNVVKTTGTGTIGVRLFSGVSDYPSDGNILIGNNITTSGLSSQGIQIYCGSNNNLVYNNITTYGGDSGAILLNDCGSANSFSYNNIYSAQDYYLYNDNANNVTAENNFWGSTDCAEINARIYDYKNNSGKGTVDYVPFLNAAWPAGSPMSNCPITSIESPANFVASSNSNNNVVLNWTVVSGADGYKIWYNENVTKILQMNESATDANVTLIGEGSNSWIDTTANLTQKRFYALASYKGAVLNFTEDKTGKYDIEIKASTGIPGSGNELNIISLPLIPRNLSIDNIISNANDNDYIYRFNTTSGINNYQSVSYFAGFGWFGDFNEFDLASGYEFKPISGNINMSIVGIVPTGNMTIPIKQSTGIPGSGNELNEISWNSPRQICNLSALIPNANDNDYIYRFNTTAGINNYQSVSYFAGFGWFGDFDCFDPGLGYVFKPVESDYEFTYTR